jgi:catechol 2,3-dioxygenase-like lactoylglutathione lyase family enzyme
MISGGNATVSVSDLDAAIRFYAEQLGLKLTNRIGNQWATIDAGPSYWTIEEQPDAGLVIGLRPATARTPPPGTTGGVGFGFETYAPIDTVAKNLKERQVRVESDIVAFDAGKVVAFVDLDGVSSYAWEFSADMLQGLDLASESVEDATGGSMLSGGHAIVYVSDMDAALRFYVDTLGLKLTYRFADKFATLLAGRNLVIALHPRTQNTPEPGTKGSVTLGLVVDGPMDKVLSRLAQRGVRATGPSATGQLRGSVVDRFLEIEDPDGNVITLWEADAFRSEVDLATAAQSNA